MQTGVNAYALYQNFNTVQNVSIEAVRNHEFACVQLHNTLMGRGDIIKETTLEIFNTKKSRIGMLYAKFLKSYRNTSNFTRC